MQWEKNPQNPCTKQMFFIPTQLNNPPLDYEQETEPCVQKKYFILIAIHVILSGDKYLIFDFPLLLTKIVLRNNFGHSEESRVIN